MIKLYEQGAVDFSKVTTFNLDEYCKLDVNDINSYHRFMHDNLFNHINIPEENINFLNGNAEDPEDECKAYEEKIKKESEITIMRKWFKKNDDEIIEIQVDDTERRIIVRALADLRDKQRLAHKNYDFLDSLIVKVCDADHPSIKDHYERC